MNRFIILMLVFFSLPLTGMQDFIEALPKSYGDSLAGAASAAVTGSDAMLFNPANLDYLESKKMELGIGISPYLSGSHLGYFRLKTDFGSIFSLGWGMTYFASGSRKLKQYSSLSVSGDTYSSDSGDTYKFGNFLNIFSLYFRTPVYISAGLNLKMERGGVTSAKSGAFKFDLGVSYNMVDNIKPNHMALTFIVPYRISVVWKDFGLVRSAVAGGKALPTYIDLRFAGYWKVDLMEYHLNALQPFYTFEAVVRPRNRNAYIIGGGNLFKLSDKFDFSLMGGFNFMADSGIKYSFGSEFQFNTHRSPITLNYSLKKYSDLGFAHTIDYKVSFDTPHMFTPGYEKPASREDSLIYKAVCDYSDRNYQMSAMYIKKALEKNRRNSIAKEIGKDIGNVLVNNRDIIRLCNSHLKAGEHEIAFKHLKDYYIYNNEDDSYQELFREILQGFSQEEKAEIHSNLSARMDVIRELNNREAVYREYIYFQIYKYLAIDQKEAKRKIYEIEKKFELANRDDKIVNLLRIGDMYYNQHKVKNALFFYMKARKLDKDNPLVYEKLSALDKKAGAIKRYIKRKYGQ